MATLAQYIARHPNPAVAQIAQQQLDIDILFDIMDFQDVPLGGIKEVHMNTLGGLQSGDGFGEAIATAAKASATTTENDRALKTIFGKIEFGEIDGMTPTEVMMQIAGRMRGHYTEWLKQLFGSTTEATKFGSLSDLVTQNVGASATKKALTFGVLDELDAECDPPPQYYIMHTKIFNKFLDLARGTSGISPLTNEGYMLPSGRLRNLVMYRGTPLLRTKLIPVRDSGGANEGYDMYALNFDTGGRVGGIGGLAKNATAMLKLTDLMPDPTIAGYFRNLSLTSAIINYNQYSSARYYTVAVS